MDDKEKLEKFARNTAGRALHDPFSWDELRAHLDEWGDDWRIVWQSIPTDGVFDSLYGETGKYEAFVYEGALYVRSADGSGQKIWEDLSDEETVTWLVENPPFDELTAIADLYEHAQGVSAGASPWLLFQYLIGTAVTTQGMGLNSLMGIGKDDGAYLGRALESWGNHDDTAEPYIELILMYGGEEG